MSMPFSDTALKTGIIQAIERRLFPSSDNPISGNAKRLGYFTQEINLALARAWELIFKADGTWKWDDDNHTTRFPVITTDLTAGRRDYAFTSDELGNVVLDIARVFIKTTATNGVYQEIYPVDVESDSGTESFTDGLEVQGIPYRYTKIGKAIILDGVPPATVADGLKVYIDREGSYFAAGDTSKVPGFAGTLHEYLAVRPSHVFATANTMSIAGGVLRNGAMTGLLREVSDWEARITRYYGSREHDRRTIIRGRRKQFK